MESQLLRSYFATLYELPSPQGTVRASLDGEARTDLSDLPPVLQGTLALVTAYNPRSMLLPRRVNEARQQVMRDMLILGVYRVDMAIGLEADKKESAWREPAWLVHGMDRDEAIAFGRVFRQNVVIYSHQGKPEIIVTDPTADDIGRTHEGHWRVRA